MENEVSMEKIVSLCKRRGFIFPGSEIYGGLSNSWDYGPLGVELKNNIKQWWWKKFVQTRSDMVGLDAALIMNPKVWEASGHLKEFSDPLVECKKCHKRFRIESEITSNSLPNEIFDHIENEHHIKVGTPSAIGFESVKSDLERMGKYLTEKMNFNLMFKTFIGPSDDGENVAYFRPETAQAMFVDFKNVLDSSRLKLPFGIAQIGKAFRNEITPGNFIFRTLEFEQMEIEYFITPPQNDGDWQRVFEEWRAQMHSWFKDLGLSANHIHELEVAPEKLAHYSKRTIDFEYDFPFGKSELYGLAYRTDFDLKNHYPEPPYRDSETNEVFYPHCIEPTWGVDRSVLAVLCEAYAEESERVILKLPALLAPYKAAVFPLLKNKPELVSKARQIYENLQKEMMVAWDDRGNIGKRYFAQDEIGTPYCITVDFETLQDKAVTVRDRDTMTQERVAIANLSEYLKERLA